MFPLNRRIKFPALALHFNKYSGRCPTLSTPYNLLYYTLVSLVDAYRLACKPDSTRLNIELTRVRHRPPGGE